MCGEMKESGEIDTLATQIIRQIIVLAHISREFIFFLFISNLIRTCFLGQDK